MPDLKMYDPFIYYMPHNGVLWMWLRTGWAGFIAFWLFIGLAIVHVCALGRRVRDPVLGAVTAIIGSGIGAVLIAGGYDQAFSTYRPMLFLGVLLGLVGVIQRITDNEAAEAECEPLVEPQPEEVLA
jgi:O-antigen ligase